MIFCPSCLDTSLTCIYQIFTLFAPIVSEGSLLSIGVDSKKSWNSQECRSHYWHKRYKTWQEHPEIIPVLAPYSPNHPQFLPQWLRKVSQKYDNGFWTSNRSTFLAQFIEITPANHPQNDHWKSNRSTFRTWWPRKTCRNVKITPANHAIDGHWACNLAIFLSQWHRKDFRNTEKGQRNDRFSRIPAW